MTVPQRSRSSWIFWSLLVVVVAITSLAYLGFRAQARLAATLREQALAHGLVVEVGKAEHDLFAIEFHDVTVRFRKAPGITAYLKRVSVHGVLFGAPSAAIDAARFVLEGEPNTLYQSSLALPEWKGVPVSWQRVDVEYPERLLGKATLTDARFERAASGLSIRAAEAKFGSVLSKNVALSLGKRNELVELGLGESVGEVRPTLLGYFASHGVASEWLLSARQQPIRPFAEQLGWELSSSFDETRVVVSASFWVPDDRARATRGNVEVALDRWPKPDWADARALLGDTAAFVAHLERPEQGKSWDLPRATLSLSLFTLTGTGKVLWGERPSVSLDLAGKLSCAQLRGNLPASVYLDQVKKYLEPEPALAPAAAAARLHEDVQLRLRLTADKAANGKREAAWHLDAGCGIAELGSAAVP